MDASLAFEEIKDIVITALGIQDRASAIEPSTPLLGGFPELDSMAVLQVIMAIEKRFDLEIQDEDLTGDAFETFGSLTVFVLDQKNI